MKSIVAFLFMLIASAGLPGFETVASAAPQEQASFESDVKPIFEKHCVRCHGAEEAEGMRLDISDDVDDYIEPGNAEDSPLYQHLLGVDEDIMPPDEEMDPLSETQIAQVRAWIEQGAEWPDGLTLTDVSTIQDADAPAGEQGEKKADETVYRAIGSLHPAAVHLPIGLLLAAGLFALLSMRGNFVMSDCAYYCLWLGTFGAIAACVSGWWFSPMEHKGTVTEFNDLFDQTHTVFWHRTTALICTAVALLLSLFAAGARAKDPEDGMLWKFGCILLAGGIGYTGHLGGEMTHPGLYKDLEKLISTITAPAEPGVEDGAADDGAGDEADQTGETSEDGAAQNGAAQNGAAQNGTTEDGTTDEGAGAGNELRNGLHRRPIRTT